MDDKELSESQLWDLRTVKSVAKIFGRIGFRGYTVDDLVDEKDGALILGPSNISEDHLVHSKNRYISWQKYEESPEIKIANGDVIFVKTASVGKVAYIEGLDCPATLNPQMIVFKQISANPKFLFYAMSSSFTKEQISKQSNGGVLETLSQNAISNFKIPVPPLEEQQAIVDYLDRETADIDNQVAEMNALVKLLEEKRQALISETVIRGIPGTHENYVDSGVEWLGEVPEGWEYQKISRFTSFFTGGTPPTDNPEYFDGGVSWATIADLQQNQVKETKTKLSTAGVEKARIPLTPAGSLLFSFKLSVGKVAITAKPVYTNEAIASFLPSSKILTKYAFYAYPIFIPKNAKQNIYGADLLNAALIKEAKIAVPSLEEQTKIIQYLDLETDRIEQIIQSSKTVINLLTEKKHSLISDVINGKWKV